MSAEKNASPPLTESPDFVSIIVHISSDLMSAHLSLDPVSGHEGILTVKHLKDELARSGVIYGVDEEKLQEIVDIWNEKPEFVESPPVAKGSAPEPGREGKLQFKVKHLVNPKDIEQAREARFFWELASLSSRFQRVDSGTVIAEAGTGLPALPGKNVCGELVSPQEREKRSDTVTGENVTISEDNRTYSATVTGIVIEVDNLPEVIPLDFNGAVEVQTSPDKMKAELVIQPAGEGGCMPSLEEIRALLKKNGVVRGVQEEKLVQIGEIFDQRKRRSEVILIAEGEPAQKGEDGKAELLFNADTSLRPRINQDGSADYKNVSIITTIVAGTKLARLHPPTKGRPGFDVTGRILPAMDGAEVKLPAGANTSVSSDDPSCLVSNIDGIVRYNGITVDVNEGYVIPGDVDYSTGNVHYDRSVVVNGDIKSGFDVQCGGDLQIGGVIEDSKVTVGGNLLCKYGFLGQGNGIIEAKGDVNLGFMKNQTVRCRGNVCVAKEVINSTIIARKSIYIHGNPLSVAGGTLSAHESIVVETTGNTSGVKTVLEIGADFTLTEELHRTESQIQELNTNLNKMVQTIKDSNPKKMSSDQLEMMKKIRRKITTIEQQISILEQRKKVITEKSNKFDASFISIERDLHPGTVFKIGQRFHFVKETITGPKTVRLIDHEIKII
ncbi:MAG: flagellar assembly protein A [Chitinispirillaceae bacterium]